jgi:hypothetical protein
LTKTPLAATARWRLFLFSTKAKNIETSEKQQNNNPTTKPETQRTQLPHNQRHVLTNALPTPYQLLPNSYHGG